MPKPILGNGDFTLPKSIVLPGWKCKNLGCGFEGFINLQRRMKNYKNRCAPR